jgi:hypothetical protein
MVRVAITVISARHASSSQDAGKPGNFRKFPEIFCVTFSAVFGIFLVTLAKRAPGAILPAWIPCVGAVAGAALVAMIPTL